MIRVLSLIVFRDWGRHKLRLVLTIAGIALGVAVFFAIRTNNSTLVTSLRSTIEKLAGKATVQIVAGEAGFSQAIVDKVRVTPGVELAEPVTETVATLPSGGERILILGLDTASELALYTGTIDQGTMIVKNPLAFSNRKDSIAITRTFADRLSLKDGDKLTINVQNGPRELTVRGIFGDAGLGGIYSGDVAVMDIYSAQEMFGRGDHIDRIDIENTSDVDVETLKSRLEAWLPVGIKAVRPDLRGQSLENSVSSMNYGLTIMSFLALTISIFIIYNSFSISVSQRWKEIGVLRAVGVVRRQVQLMFVFEGLFLGAVGSMIGVAAGYGLARLSVRFVGDVTASFYGVSPASGGIGFSFTFALQAVAAGLIASLIAAWIPARAASNLEPALSLRNIETRESSSVAGLPRTIAGLVFLLAGLALTRFAPADVGSNIQLFYSFFIQFGMILLVPRFIQIGGQVLRPVMDRLFGAEGLIAIETMVRAPRRTTATVIALMIGLSFVISNSAFIQSQKKAMNRSLDRAVAADLLVTASNEVHSRTYHFSEATANKIKSLPGVETADTVRVTSVEYGGQEVAIISHEMRELFKISPDLLDVGDKDAAIASTSAGTGVIVSTNFANRWAAKLGDSITLATPTGPLTLKVVGMLDYYRSDKGTLFFDKAVYKKYWGDSDVDYLFINVKPGSSIESLRSSIVFALGGSERGFIYTHDEYKRWVSAIIDQFFALMYVQMFVAACVAMLGLANTMVISVSERRRELGIFRAVGGLRGQVAKMVIVEAVAIALIGYLAGVLCGLFNSYYLVTAAVRIIAGYSLPLVFPTSVLLIAIPAIILIAVISAAVPARNAARSNVVEAIGCE